MGGPCVSPSPFGLDFWTSDSGLTTELVVYRHELPVTVQELARDSQPQAGIITGSLNYPKYS